LKKLLFTLTLAFMLLIAAVPLSAIADTYPDIALDVTATTHVIPQGETGDVTFLVAPAYPRERYTVEIFNSDGKSLAKVQKEYKNTSLEVKSFTLYIKSGEYNLPVGEYTIKYYLEYYSNSKWNKCPTTEEWTVYIVPNVCNGDHTTALALTLEEATCTETGLGMYECKFCGYLETKEIPTLPHPYGEGVETKKPTLTAEGEISYTCTVCGDVKTEAIPVLKILTQPGNVHGEPGKNASVGVYVDGVIDSYTWYEKLPGADKFSVADHKTNTYTLKLTEEVNGTQVYCVITDKYGNKVTSDTVTLTMPVYANIKTQPVSTAAEEGKTAKVSLVASGDGIKYEWYYKSAGMTKFVKTTAFTGNTYAVAMNADRDGRQVYCVVTDKYGNKVTSDTVTLRMGTPVSIKVQPKDVTVPKGDTAAVSLTAAGSELTYTWYYKSVGMTRFIKTSAFTGNTYSVEMDALRNGRQIYCVVTDKYGVSVKSDTVTIAMATPLEITLQPVGGTVYEGETATVSVVAQGDGLTYQWYYAPEGSSEFAKSSIASDEYNTVMNASRDGRQLRCVVTDKYGNSVTSDTVSIRMATPLKITAQPKDVCAQQGRTASVKVEATGDGLRYAWYYKNRDMTGFVKTSSFSGSTYAVSMTEARHNREIYCVITDRYGSSVTSDTVTLTMAVPLEITVQPKDRTTVYDEKSSVGIAAQGEGLTYEWYVALPGSEEFVLTDVTASSYPYTMDKAHDGMQVYCVVTDRFGNIATSDTAVINGKNELRILTQPVSVGVPEGATATVSFKAAGDELTYEWYYKSVGMSDFAKTTAFTGNTYSVAMTAARDGRQIFCIVTDKSGNTLATDTVTISIKPTELKITSQPDSVAVKEGDTARVFIKAQGDGLTYEWYYKSVGATKFSKTTAFTGTSYSVEMNASRDGRQLYCVVTDRYGNKVTSDTVTISMIPELKITSQPVSVTVADGAKATVKVTASGDGLSYQWYYAEAGSSNFSKSSTTSATYSVTMNESRDGRQLYCVVTDEYGDTVKSNTVTINMK